MNFDYDVVIIGAGPVGSTIAYYLTKSSLKILLIEKKKDIGQPLQCAGILSKCVVDYNDFPQDIVLNKVNGAFLHTQNHILNVKKDNVVAYVIDRIKYDQYLFKRAINNNVDFINQKVVDYDINKGFVYFENNQKVKSKIIVGCDGYNSRLSNAMGNDNSNFQASQMLVEIDEKSMHSFRKSNKSIDEYVDTFLINDILPGFIWIIPLRNNQYRVGLFSNDNHKNQDKFLNRFLNDNFNFKILEKYKGFIPIFDEKNQIVKSRAILIGDAASQIKPTSGGGLIIGFDACKIASKYIIEAIKKDNVNVLESYQKEFNESYLKEFNYQFKVQKTLNMLSDEDLDYLFLKLKENDCESLISQYGDMDKQSTLVKEFIKRGLIFKIIPSFLFKKLINIFGFR